MDSRKTNARILGLLFLFAFVAYGLGNGLVVSILNPPNYLSNIWVCKNQFIFGAILMSVVHSSIIVGIGVLTIPIIKAFHQNIALAYLSALITTSAVLLIGVLFLLMLLPLSHEYLKAIPCNSAYFQMIANLLIKGNYFAYQIAMSCWALGGLAFCYLMFRSKLLPRFLSAWGFAAYLIFLAGTICELFDYNIGILMSIPGGLFEIMLSFWLIIRGFSFSNELIDLPRS